MEMITARAVVAVVLRLVSIALLVGAVVWTGSLIVHLAYVMGLGEVSWGGSVVLLLLLSVAPAFVAIVVWKAANRIRRGGQDPPQ